MIEGLITGKEVLRNGGCIVRSFGLRSYLRCLLALLSRRRATFLELIWAGQAA
ncbi:MAG: hypothetical protein ACJ79O_08765 [Myxococcales bacterium]|nr:hypothetical protein [Myxococcales bacterium]